MSGFTILSCALTRVTHAANCTASSAAAVSILLQNVCLDIILISFLLLQSAPPSCRIVSASTGNPPPTSEKLVTTEVCGKSGEPIVISGLIQNSTSQGNSGIPLISKLPLLGMLFKHSEKTTEKTQMIIYLVPHIESYSEETDKEENAFNLSWIQKYCDILSGKICEKRITFLEVHNEEL